MKTTVLFFAICLVANCSNWAVAQMDSLTVGDTISVKRQPTLFSYSRTYQYHLANNLRSIQLIPLLKRSDNEQVRQGIRRYNRQRVIAFTVMGTGYASMVSGLFLVRRRPEIAMPLMLGGIGLFYGAPVFRPERSLERTVKQYNGFLRSKSEDYYRPLYELGGQTGPLTLADTIERRKGAQFWYRGVRVDPADNLRLAFDRLNNGRLSGNMKYIRTGRWVSGFAGGLASGVLAGYLLGYALRRNNGSIYPADQTLIYSAAAVIGVTTIYNRVHLNHVQRGTVDDYNKRLREAIRGEGQE